MAQSRKDIAPQYKWRLNAIFATKTELEEAVKEVKRLIALLKKEEGALDVKRALKVLEIDSSIAYLADKIYVYTHLKSDENTADSKVRAVAARAEMLMTEYSAASSWILPALVAMSEQELDQIAEKNADYSRLVASVQQQKAHTLSDKEEKLLAEMGSFAGEFRTIFMMFNNADIKFKSIKNELGADVDMTHGTYSLMLQSDDKRVRRDAFDSHYQAYKDSINTIAANYYAHVKKNVFFAKIRKYGSPLEKALLSEEITAKTYKTLLASVERGLARLHDYVALRKRLLGGELNMYDMYVPIFKTDKGMPYEKAYSTVLEALAPLGKDYVDLLKKAQTGGWIDVYETPGKRSGAYSWGAYGSHPYVLLNYTETMHDVFTIAHEMGHALHSYYSNEAQCFEKASYVIFVAEVASTVNEVLLLKHLLKSAKGEEKKFLLSYYLDMFRTTLFRQTMFSEFETFAHAEVKKGNPLTVDNLSTEYYRLNQKYYGDSVHHNDDIRYEWARIPHFYTSFYVYKYATGITSAVTIANAILSGDKSARDRYLKMLSLGGSMPPLDILRVAGVDLESRAPYESVLREFDATLRELEETC